MAKKQVSDSVLSPEALIMIDKFSHHPFIALDRLLGDGESSVREGTHLTGEILLERLFPTSY